MSAVSPTDATTVFLDTIAKTSGAALALTATLPPADRLRTLRDLKKRIEADEKAAAEIVKADHHPAIGVQSFAYRSEVAGSTSWKAVAEKLAGDAGITLDDAFCAAFKGAPSVRVDVRELYDLVEIVKGNPTIAGIDFETNGFAVSDGVVSVGICTTNVNDLSGEQWSSLVNLEGRRFSPDAAKTHGLTEAELATAPKWLEIASEVTELLRGAVLVGHNLPFELRFLEALGVRKVWRAEVDTLVLARTQRPDLASYRLEEVAKAYEVDGRRSDVHSAEEDARMALEIFLEAASIAAIAAGAL